MEFGRVWLLTVTAGCLGAQSQATFDSASIKLADPGAKGSGIMPLPGRIRAQNVTLNMLIGEAYHVYDFQISGGPKWCDSERYDVEAKAAGDVPPAPKEMRAMLRKLLAERFGLDVSIGKKEMTVLALETAKGGAKLQRPSNPDSPVGFKVYQRRQIIASNAPLDYLTEALTWITGQPVLDRTALDGTFDYKLEWSPDERQTSSTEAPVETDGKLPSLTGALQQVGLKLTSRKDSVDWITVEKAEHPANN